MTAAIDRTFSSLHVPNYRRYFAGQAVSISGNWMQIVAEMWLIVELTGSGTAVGITAGLQFLPMLLFGGWGGVLADRLDKRRLLTLTQSLMVIPAVTLWALTAGGAVEAWMVFALVLVRGTITAIDNPARQAFVSEIVGADRVVNAVALNSVDRALVAHRRTRGGGWADRPARRGGVLRRQLGDVRRDDRRAAAHGRRPAAPERARPAGAGPAPGRARLRPPDAGAAHPARDDGPRRHGLVQLPGAAAAAGERHLARDGGDLRAADRGDGRRLGVRRPGRGRARARDRAAAGR